MAKKIVECPRCGKEITISVDVLENIVFVQQDEEQEDLDLQSEYFESELEEEE